MSDPKPHAIDWSALHRRLEVVRSALDASAKMLPEVRRAVLTQRAERVAATPAASLPPGKELRVLELVIVPETYAVPLEFVVQVAALREFSLLPKAPSFVLGVSYLQGRMICVVDLRRFFGLPDAGLTDQNRLVVLEHGELELGIVADEVRSIRALSLDDLAEPLPAMASGTRASFCKGIASGGLLVLDVPKLLASTNSGGALGTAATPLEDTT